VGPEAVRPGRPAFYALRSGGWRDYVTLLHAPYTLWHLSYVAIGAALAPMVLTNRLLWTLAAFALALGVGAHALDELNGRPLDTQIPSRVLWALALASIGGAVAIGVAGAAAWSWWLLAFVAAGGFLVFAYNLELAGGRFHTDLWFGLAWGAFPLLTGYFAQAGRLRPEAVLAAAFATLLSLAQRVLSTQVRTVRRRVTNVSGEVTVDGATEPVTVAWLMGACETALRLLAAAVILLAVALLTWRLR
jgi:hypothetical protein